MQVADVVSAYTKGKASLTMDYTGVTVTAVLPNPQTELGSLNVEYDLTVWEGGPEAYLRCNAEQRIQGYAGTCTKIADSLELNGVVNNVRCAANVGNTWTPYNCSTIDGQLLYNTDNSSMTTFGNMSNVDYRQSCEVPCSMQEDCNALCICTPVCGIATEETCVCQECNSIIADLVKEAAFEDIMKNASYASSDDGGLATTSSGSGRRRQLMATEDEKYQQALSEINYLRLIQVNMEQQMADLSADTDLANLYATVSALGGRCRDALSIGRAGAVMIAVYHNKEYRGQVSQRSCDHCMRTITASAAMRVLTIG